MSRLFRKSLLVSLLVTLIFTLGWTAHRQADHQQHMQAGYALPAQYQHVKNGIMVFCYHRVLQDSLPTRLVQGLSNNSQLHEFNVPLDQFKSQMKFLKDHHVQVISADTMTQMVRSGKPIHGKYAVLSFDDIDRTVVDNAIPVMKHYNFPFTAFIITGNTGEYREGTQLATWRQITAAQQSAGALMTLGLHTHNLHHLSARFQPVFMQPHFAGRFQRDFDLSKRELRQHTGVLATSFAFPYGSGTTQINRFLASQHLDWVATLNSGIVTDQTDLNVTPRIVVNQESWPSMKTWLSSTKPQKD